MTIRCKLTVHSVTQYSYPPGTGEVNLTAIYDSKPGVEGNAVTENHIFGKATPNATFKMTILNPDAFQEFRKALDNGVPWYVDFTPAQ